ncbi:MULTISPECIES: serine O-acetyltransferase [unclassified Sinorhizobium]|uniref:serine O-acetyltransferase n=1 Tax=unclassified Sinorhizobium TaxID=2613772 RepID=UPI003523275A
MYWRGDLKVNANKASAVQAFISYFTSPSFKVVARYRMYRWLYQRGPIGKALHKPLWFANCKMGAYISPKAKIGASFYLPHPIGVVVGEGVVIGDDVTLFQGVTLGVRREGGHDYPTLGNGVTVYANATIVGAVVLGDRAKVGANAFVRESIPADTTVVSAPATVVPRKNASARETQISKAVAHS